MCTVGRCGISGGGCGGKFGLEARILEGNRLDGRSVLRRPRVRVSLEHPVPILGFADLDQFARVVGVVLSKTATNHHHSIITLPSSKKRRPSLTPLAAATVSRKSTPQSKKVQDLFCNENERLGLGKIRPRIRPDQAPISLFHCEKRKKRRIHNEIGAIAGLGWVGLG